MNSFLSSKEIDLKHPTCCCFLIGDVSRCAHFSGQNMHRIAPMWRTMSSARCSCAPVGDQDVVQGKAFLCVCNAVVTLLVTLPAYTGSRSDDGLHSARRSS